MILTYLEKKNESEEESCIPRIQGEITVVMDEGRGRQEV